jgi:hypothetical protein
MVWTGFILGFNGRVIMNMVVNRQEVIDQLNDLAAIQE